MKALLFLLLSCIGANALACGCDKPRSIADVAWKDPTYIFDGVVDDVVTEKRGRVTYQTVTFKITRLHKGPQAERITVLFNQGNSSCDLEPLNFSAGQAFLLSASPVNLPQTDFFNYSNFCDLREPR